MRVMATTAAVEAAERVRRGWVVGSMSWFGIGGCSSAFLGWVRQSGMWVGVWLGCGGWCDTVWL